MNMKTSKWFYGIALTSLVCFTAAADNVPASQPTGGTTMPTVQNNLVIQGTVKTDGDNQGPKPTKPVTVTIPNKSSNNNNGVINQGT